MRAVISLKSALLYPDCVEAGLAEASLQDLHTEVVSPTFHGEDQRNSLGTSALTLAVAALRFWISYNCGLELQCNMCNTPAACNPEVAVKCAAAPGLKTGASAESWVQLGGLMPHLWRQPEALQALQPLGSAAPRTL